MSSKPQPPSNACHQAQEAIIALLDDEFIPEQQTFLALHLPACPACQAYHESMQHLTLSLRKLDQVPVPNGLENLIMARLAANTETESRTFPMAAVPSRRGSWLKTAPLAAAALFIALALPWMIQTLHFNGQNQPNSIGSTLPVAPPQIVAKGQVANPVPEVSSIPASRELANASNLQPRPSVQADSSQSTSSAVSLTSHAAVAPQSSIVKPEPTVPGVTSVANGPTDTSEVASAVPSSVNLDSTYASTSESDVYYDPVSNLVQF